MNIEQLRKIAKLTKSKKIILKLLDEDETKIQDIITIVDGINKVDIIYTEDEIDVFIDELLIGIKEFSEFHENLSSIILSLTGKHRKRKEETTMDDINSMLKLYREEEYNDITKTLIKNYKPMLSKEDFIKIYNSLKTTEFKVDLSKCRSINKETSEFIPTRKINEICKMIEEDNGLSPVLISEVYFDEDLLKYRNYNETKLLGNKIVEAYNSEEYKEKIDQDEVSDYEDIVSISVDKFILTHTTLQQQLSLMDEFIKEPSDKLYHIILDRDLIEHRSHPEIMKLIKIFKENPDTYELIISHNLLLLPFEIQKECINLISSSKSPYIKDIVSKSEKPITKEFIEELKKLDNPITVNDELEKSKTIDEFIDSLEKNNITEFTGSTKVYTKNNN